MRILLVEDDPLLGDGLTIGLRQSGLDVAALEADLHVRRVAGGDARDPALQALGGLLGGAAGSMAGAKVGDVVDEKVLGNLQCGDCGHVFSDR